MWKKDWFQLPSRSMYRFCSRRSLYSASSADSNAGRAAIRLRGNLESMATAHLDLTDASPPGQPFRLLRASTPFVRRPFGWRPALISPWSRPCKPVTSRFEATTGAQRSQTCSSSTFPCAIHGLASIERTYRMSCFDHVQVQISWVQQSGLAVNVGRGGEARRRTWWRRFPPVTWQSKDPGRFRLQQETLGRNGQRATGKEISIHTTLLDVIDKIRHVVILASRI